MFYVAKEPTNDEYTIKQSEILYKTQNPFDVDKWIKKHKNAVESYAWGVLGPDEEMTDPLYVYVPGDEYFLFQEAAVYYQSKQKKQKGIDVFEQHMDDRERYTPNKLWKRKKLLNLDEHIHALKTKRQKLAKLEI
jgi:hypothetical protein